MQKEILLGSLGTPDAHAFPTSPGNTTIYVTAFHSAASKAKLFTAAATWRSKTKGLHN